MFPASSTFVCDVFVNLKDQINQRVACEKRSNETPSLWTGVGVSTVSAERFRLVLISYMSWTLEVNKEHFIHLIDAA